MAKKKKTSLIAAAAAFAASPQGRRLLQMAKEYASKPENQARARQLIADARARRKGGYASSPSAQRYSTTGNVPYGTPPRD